MTPLTWLTLLIGLAVLTAGAELLVRGASRLAASFGLSPLVIGLTVVAYGTSTPELAVSAKSALAGQSDIAIGNVVGSNIFNVLFILGACALILPLTVHAQLVRTEVPLMIGVSVLLLLMGLDNTISRVDGSVLLGAIVVYTAFLVIRSRKEPKAAVDEFQSEYAPIQGRSISRLLLDVVFIGAGLALLAIGARYFVDSSIDIARHFGVDELVIGLTIVAAGTSLPEVATSIIATIRGERDIAIGNVIGSNIYNILAVLGVASIIKPVAVSPAALTLDIPVMVAVAVACLPIFFTGLSIARWEGALFLAFYIAYTAYLVMQAGKHDAAPVYSEIMLMLVLPLTAVTLTVLALNEWRGGRNGKSA